MLKKTCILIMIVLFMTVFPGCHSDTENNQYPESAVEHGCEWSETLPESRPSDFNILFKYGYSKAMRNALDTFTGTYTKDLGNDPPITVEFRLTDEEMERIYQKMVEIDFFCYPEKFVIPLLDGEIVSAVSNNLQYFFRVECNNKVKIVQWSDYILYKNEDAGELRRLIRLIRNIIESKEEYKNLPSSKGIII